LKIDAVVGIFWAKYSPLQDETKYVWLDLCAEAAICEDPTRLKQLAVQIADLLRQEEERLDSKMLCGSTSRVSRTVA
jgi:hypothetical protein